MNMNVKDHYYSPCECGFLTELRLHTLLSPGTRWGSGVTALPWLLCSYPIRHDGPHSCPGTSG